MVALLFGASHSVLPHVELYSKNFDPFLNFFSVFVLKDVFGMRVSVNEKKQNIVSFVSLKITGLFFFELILSPKISNQQNAFKYA